MAARFGAPCHARMSCEIGSTATSAAAMTPARSPQNARASANAPSIEVTAKTQMPCVSTVAGSPDRDRNEPYRAGSAGSSLNGTPSIQNGFWISSSPCAAIWSP